MTYQRIFQPGPRSNRFPFHGLGEACCAACAHNLPCGTPLGQTKLTTGAPKNGEPTRAPGTAGPVPELSALERDVKTLAVEAHRAWGDIAFNRTVYDRLKRQGLEPATGTFRMTAEEAKQFVTGTVVDVTAALVKARELALLDATTPTRRDQLRAAQRRLATSGRATLDHATRALDSASHESGVSGLGFVCAGACIATIVAIAAGAALLIGGAAVYAWSASASELHSAMIVADRICRETPGGCSAQQRAQIISDLRMPNAVTTGVQNVTRGIGSGLETVIVVVGVGGALALAGWAWLRFSKSGRRLSRRFGGVQ